MHAETQIKNISVLFSATPKKFMQYYGPSGAIEFFHFSIWIDRRLRLAVQRPTARMIHQIRSLIAADPFLSLRMIQKVLKPTVSTINGHRSYDREVSDRSKRTCENAVQRQPMSTI
jgi:hypothetical protein